MESPISQKHLSHPRQNETTSNIEMKTFDVDSVESSDTYASCTTHPFNSFDDFTDDTTQTQNVYINPMEKMPQTSKTDTQKINKSLTNEDIASGIKITNNRLINSILKENGKSNDTISTTSTASPFIKKTKHLQNLKTRFNDGSNTPTDDTDFSKPIKPKVSIKESFFPYRGMILKLLFRKDHFQTNFNYLGRTGSGSKTALLVTDSPNESSKKKSILKRNDSNNNNNNNNQNKEEMEKLLPCASQNKNNNVNNNKTNTNHLLASPIAPTSNPSIGYWTPQTTNALFFENISSKSRPTLKQIGSSKQMVQSTLLQNPSETLLPTSTQPSTTRLIGAVTPIQLTPQMSSIIKRTENTPVIRCSNPSCYFNRVGHASSLCTGCGHKMETLNQESNSLKPHSVPLSPSTPDQLQEVGRQPSNESAPPAC